MNIINLTNIGEYPDDLILAKIDIEKNLLKLENHMSISEFIRWLKLNKTIYVWEEQFIPFYYVEVNENKYLFLTTEIKEENILKKIIDNITSKIISSENNLTNILRKLSKEEMILNENGIPKTDYFFIDGEIYV